MKQFIAYIALLVFALIGNVTAQEVSRPSSVPGQTYGKAITEDGAVDIATIPELIAQSENKKVENVKIYAKVLNVCAKKGCWMDLYVDEDTKIFVKMKDYAFFVPDDMIGKTVVLEGEAFEKVTSVNELRHYAEDAKKSQEEIDAITEPEKSIRFLAYGIVVPKK